MNKRRSLAIAIAACSFALPALTGDKKSIWLQVTPVGYFKPSDGREMKVPAWHIDAAVASKVIQRFKARKTPPVLDYEHQTLHKEENGQPAPAAGRFRELEWRDGEGLYGLVDLTARASGYIDAEEYLFFSPVFLYHPVTGDVLDIQMGALTNHPAIDGMEALSLRAAATFGLTLDDDEDHHVNPLLKAVLAALGLSETTTEEQAVVALTAHHSTQVALRKTLGIDDAANGDVLLAACTGLKAKAATIDPAQYVPINVVEGLKGEVAALTSRLQARDDQDTGTLIETALADGRLLKVQEAWARDLGKSNRAALTSYLDTAKPIAALAGSQTGGKDPVLDEKTGLTDVERAACTAMGLTAEQFKAAKE